MTNCNFLVIDNSKTSQQMLVDMMKQAGYSNICTASSALDALELLGVREDQTPVEKEPTVDIIITSLVLPKMDGIDFCRRIKKEPRLAHIPVVMITAADDKEIQEAAFQAGIFDYIIKPFNSVLVLARIKAVLRLNAEMKKGHEREKQLEQYNHNLVKDLQVARQLQKHILPSALTGEKLSISGCYLPMDFLGGDLYYWERLDDHRYGIILLDVVGHGTAPSMIGMYLRAMLPLLCKQETTVAGLLGRLNTMILELNQQLSQDEYYCTAIYMIVDTKRQTLEYANAGGTPAVLVADNRKVRWLEEGCPPVGMFDQLVIESETIAYNPKERILLYSDGLYEQFRNKEISLEYLLNYLKAYGHEARQASAAMEKFSEVVALLPRKDDISLVCLDLL